jgi:NADH-quinone oxidoreductase subunit F
METLYIVRSEKTISRRSGVRDSARAKVAAASSCRGNGCIANGSLRYTKGLKNGRGRQHKSVSTDILDCSPKDLSSPRAMPGICQVGPPSRSSRVVLLPHVKIEDVAEIVEQTVKAGKVIDRLLYKDPVSGTHKKGKGEITFYAKQDRKVLAACGVIDPEDLNEYIARDGYKAARKALFDMTSAEVCEEMKASGLRGRGGAGFPTGKKWELALRQNESEKYFIADGDEATRSLRPQCP